VTVIDVPSCHRQLPPAVASDAGFRIREADRVTPPREMMSDLSGLETTIASAIAAAADEAALEAVRIAALGKKGSVSELLKTLGAMTPDERREKGPLINGLRDRVSSALAERKTALAEAALTARLASRTRRRDAAGAEGPADRGRIHPISQVIDELTAIFADLGFCHRRRAGHRDRLTTISPR
jgi:phenylalanyl-tRNA synthetase alpha subunit